MFQSASVRSNASLCPVHQDYHTDIQETAFQLALLTSMELSPHTLALAAKLHEHMVSRKGGLPEEVSNYESWPKDLPPLTGIVTGKAVMRLRHLRSDYMVMLFIKVLSFREEFAKWKLVDRLPKLRAEFHQLDLICGLCEPETIAAAYGAALMSIVKTGGFKVEDVTESASSQKKGNNMDEAASANANASAAVDADSGPSLTSQQELSQYGIRQDYVRDADVSSTLKSAERIFELRTSLCSQLVNDCRTDLVISHCHVGDFDA